MINYKLLQDSLDYYTLKGFSRIEVPWTVSEEINNLTKPKEVVPLQLKHNNKCLVGSAEQGFLSLVNKGFLMKGKYISLTPCFRDEDFTLLHTKYFMKSEIFINDDVSDKTLKNLIGNAMGFFDGVLGDKVSLVPTDIGYDIEYEGIELGSYGIRDFGFVRYIYGTSCAEPRLSRVKSLHGLSH